MWAFGPEALRPTPGIHTVQGENQFPKLSSDLHTSTTVTPPTPTHTHTQKYDEKKLKKKKRGRLGLVARDYHPSAQKLHFKFKASLGFGEFQGSRAPVRHDPKKKKKEGSERGKKRERKARQGGTCL